MRIALILLVLASLAIMGVVIADLRGGTPDACEMRYAPEYSACLDREGWSLSIPPHQQQSIEHDCRQEIQPLIRECRRARDGR